MQMMSSPYDYRSADQWRVGNAAGIEEEETVALGMFGLVSSNNTFPPLLASTQLTTKGLKTLPYLSSNLACM
jgi:hypothetical protein